MARTEKMKAFVKWIEDAIVEHQEFFEKFRRYFDPSQPYDSFSPPNIPFMAKKLEVYQTMAEAFKNVGEPGGFQTDDEILTWILHRAISFGYCVNSTEEEMESKAFLYLLCHARAFAEFKGSGRA